MQLLLGVVVGAIGLWILDRLLLMLEARGHIYYRRINARGACASALTALHELQEPQAARVVEVMEHEEPSDDLSGSSGPTGPNARPTRQR